MSEPLTDNDLQEIEAYLADEAGAADARTRRWLSGLLDEVRRHRGGQGEPLKQHGDALLDGSGTRHGV